MARFKGQAEYSVDSKGRVAIPAKMRAALSPAAKNTFTITRGIDRCIYLYAQDDWEGMEEKFSRLNAFRVEERDFLRLTMMWAEDVTFDGQGRIGIPRPLMEHAGVTDRALIIGVLDRIEIWNPDEFAKRLATAAADYEALAERVMGGDGRQ
ncbi:MAG TPA: division/cell wall cluster transcriptional repressor MraZ [Rhodothermales bacterium]